MENGCNYIYRLAAWIVWSIGDKFSCLLEIKIKKKINLKCNRFSLVNKTANIFATETALMGLSQCEPELDRASCEVEWDFCQVTCCYNIVGLVGNQTTWSFLSLNTFLRLKLGGTQWLASKTCRLIIVWSIKMSKKASQSCDGLKQKIIILEKLEPPNIWYLEGQSTDQ